MGLESKPRPGRADASAAWWHIDEPLRVTLERSFADRRTGQPAAAENLANAWYAGGDPATVEDALEQVGAQGLNILTRVHDRIVALDPSLQTWRRIRYIRNLWWGGSAGFKVVYEERAALRAGLDALFPRVARDATVGALEHQRGSSLRHLLRAIPRALSGAAPAPPDCDTFREVDQLGHEGLHFCVATRDPSPTALDDIHLDWCSPVRRVDPVTRRCVYAPGLGAWHWLQARTRLGRPVLAFDAIDHEIARVTKLRGPRDDAWDAWDAWDQCVERWLDVKWGLAARGRAGHDTAIRWWKECAALGASFPR